MRDVRTIERSAEQQPSAAGDVVPAYAAVRSALTDDARPPLAFPGLRLAERPQWIESSLQTALKRGAATLKRLQGILERALERCAPLWTEVRQGAQWVCQASTILNNADGASAQTVWQRYEQWLQELERDDVPQPLQESARHFLRVTRSYGSICFTAIR